MLVVVVENWGAGTRKFERANCPTTYAQGESPYDAGKVVGPADMLDKTNCS
jgi:hypothetical protein